MVEKTYAMIKPDAMAAGKAEEIMKLIEEAGFTIVASRKVYVRFLTFRPRELFPEDTCLPPLAPCPSSCKLRFYLLGV
jgi:hypothetical protein